jgi:hypothetical protein
MSKEIERPDCVTDEHLEFLDELRDSGETNMFGARPYLVDEFMLSKDESAKVLSYWMASFGERHKATAKEI